MQLPLHAIGRRPQQHDKRWHGTSGNDECSRRVARQANHQGDELRVRTSQCRHDRAHEDGHAAICCHKVVELADRAVAASICTATHLEEHGEAAPLTRLEEHRDRRKGAHEHSSIFDGTTATTSTAP